MKKTLWERLDVAPGWKGFSTFLVLAGVTAGFLLERISFETFLGTALMLLGLGQVANRIAAERRGRRG